MNKNIKFYSIEDKVSNTIPLSKIQMAFYPGAFNPLHREHRYIAYDVNYNLKKRLVFEVSRTGQTKGRKTDKELEKVKNQFSWYNEVLITDAPWFFEKRNLISQYIGDYFWFVIGYDTFKRWLQDYTPETHDIFNLILYKRVIDNILYDPEDLIDSKIHNFEYIIRDNHYENVSSTKIKENKNDNR